MNTNEDILLHVENLVMHFPIYRGVFRRQVGAVHAVDGVSFDVKRGETLGYGEKAVRIREPGLVLV